MGDLHPDGDEEQAYLRLHDQIHALRAPRPETPKNTTGQCLAEEDHGTFRSPHNRSRTSEPKGSGPSNAMAVHSPPNREKGGDDEDNNRVISTCKGEPAGRGAVRSTVMSVLTRDDGAVPVRGGHNRTPHPYTPPAARPIENKETPTS